MRQSYILNAPTWIESLEDTIYLAKEKHYFLTVKLLKGYFSGFHKITMNISSALDSHLRSLSAILS